MDSIDRTVYLRDALITFGQASQSSLPPQGAALHLVVEEIGQAGMQPILNGCVLLLSAALEQFISDLIVAFAEELPNIISQYQNLPERIRSANERMTGEALSSARYRNRFSAYDRRTFVENLSKCHAGEVPYVINGEALALHNSNISPQLLRELTRRIGVEGVWDSISTTEALGKWAELESASAVRTLAETKLDELIQTRNQIAHRVGVAEPGPDIVRSFVEFEKAFANSLEEILANYADSLVSANGSV